MLGAAAYSPSRGSTKGSLDDSFSSNSTPIYRKDWEKKQSVVPLKDRISSFQRKVQEVGTLIKRLSLDDPSFAKKRSLIDRNILNLEKEQQDLTKLTRCLTPAEISDLEVSMRRLQSIRSKIRCGERETTLLENHQKKIETCINVIGSLQSRCSAILRSCKELQKMSSSEKENLQETRKTAVGNSLKSLLRDIFYISSLSDECLKSRLGLSSETRNALIEGQNKMLQMEFALGEWLSFLGNDQLAASQTWERERLCRQNVDRVLKDFSC